MTVIPDDYGVISPKNRKILLITKNVSNLSNYIRYDVATTFLSLSYFLPLGKCVPNALSSLLRIAPFGMALPDSYS